jgi:hypothetical protein
MTANAPAHDAAAIAESKAAYLERYYEITQSLIGVMRLHATPEQRAKVAVWDEALDDLQAARWHALGVPLDAMGNGGIFVIDDAAVARLRAHISQAKGE